MPPTQLVQARIDGEIKAQAGAVLADMGLTISDAVRILLTRVAREKLIPLELLRPNATTLEALEEARSRQLPRFSSVHDLLNDLHAED